MPLVLIVNKRTYPLTDIEYVGRPSPLGNPFEIGCDGTRRVVIEKYRLWLHEKISNRDPLIITELTRLHNELVSKYMIKLACWCSPLQCHACVIKHVLDNWEKYMSTEVESCLDDINEVIPPEDKPLEDVNDGDATPAYVNQDR